MSIFRNGLVTPTIIALLVLPFTGSHQPAQAYEVESSKSESLTELLKNSSEGDVEHFQGVYFYNAEGQELNSDGSVKLPPPPPEAEIAPEPDIAAANITAEPLTPIQAGSILEAARAQLGQAQDCTALVERSLRAVGINVGDVAPMGFASFGVQVSADDAQPGDILMRAGHAAIYAGNNVAVHGGFNGSTVESATDGNPHSYTVIVRVK